MSPGSNKRPTGTVPKTKPDRKNSVPQEMVAPTRRDLQEHLNVSVHFDFFFSCFTHQHQSKYTNKHFV